MRIIWHSAAPWINTGYGRCTREVVSRLKESGHEVAVHCMNSLKEESILWDGSGREVGLDDPIKVYPAEGPFGLGNFEDSFEDFNADFYFTHFDTWMKPAREKIPNAEIPYGSYVIVDHDPAPEAVVQQVGSATETVAMSKWAKKKLEEKGVRPTYIPHGVSTDDYYPIPDGSDKKPKKMEVATDDGDTRIVNLEDTFFVGMVAANHGDRKRIPTQMEAFKLFLEEVDNSALMYVHTDFNAQEGYNLNDIREEIGIPKENLLFADREQYQNVDDSVLNRWYNSFDVFMNCSQGESWGLCITEAMAAGTPPIVTNFSSMPEQLGMEPEMQEAIRERSVDIYDAHHGIVVNPATSIWRERVSSRQMVVDHKDVKKALEFYYNNEDIREEHGMLARDHVEQEYSWDNNIAPAFVEMFNRVEARL